LQVSLPFFFFLKHLVEGLENLQRQTLGVTTANNREQVERLGQPEDQLLLEASFWSSEN
jgi:hypothetical protein